VQRHGVGDGAVEIEEIRLEVARWKIESCHRTGNITEVPSGAAAQRGEPFLYVAPDVVLARGRERSRS
jgi:hypothetical protein